MVDVHATGLTLWVVENRIAMKRSQGIGSIDKTSRRVLIRIDTDAGVCGYGEAAPWAVFSGTVESAVSGLARYFWPHVKGARVADIPKIIKACERAAVGHPEAKAAIEVALYDIVGKAAGLPIYQLLGGKARDRIPLSFSLANPDLAADLKLADAMYAEGVRIFKIKTGFMEHRDDLKRVETIRTNLPGDVDLRIDYNQGLDAFGAVAKLRDMETFRLTFIEQPVRADQWTAMAELTRRVETPILADESVFDPATAQHAVFERIADAFSVKIMKAGGLVNARAIATIAEQAGLPCYGGTLWEGAIALNAGAHLIAATGTISLGCEFYMPRYVFAPEELEAPLDLRDGYVYPAEGPGLGIEVDEDVIARTAIDTLSMN